MTFVTFVAPLAAIGLVRGDMENALDCCGVLAIAASVTTKIKHVARFVRQCPKY